MAGNDFPIFQGNNKVEIALNFARAGFKIIPQDKNKKPILKWEQATPDQENILAWAKQYPRCNFALITDEKLFVLDLDIKGDKNGIAEFEKIPGFQSPNTLIVRSGSGGQHFYFYSKNGPVKNCDFNNGIEVKGAPRACITLPGSNYNDGRKYEIIKDAQIAEAPEWLIKYIVTYKSEEKIDNHTTTNDYIAEGERNNFLLKKAGKLRHAGFSANAIFYALKEMNKEKCNPPLPEKEIKSIAEYTGSKKTKEQQTAEERLQGFNFVTLEAERLADVPARTWYIENMITPGYNQVIARKAMGKSALVLQMANAIGEGKPFLGFPTKQSFALVALTEIDKIGLHERACRLGKCSENVLISYGWSKGEQAIKDAALVIKELKIGVIIFDMFRAVLPDDFETNSYDVTPLLLKWRRLGLETGTAIVGTWHSTKADNSDFMLWSLGTTGLGAQADSIIAIDRKRGDSIGKIFVGGNHAAETVFKVQFENCIFSRIEGQADFLNNNDKLLIEVVKKHTEGIGPSEAAAFVGRSYDVIRLALVNLAARGLIRKIGRGRYAPALETEVNRNIPNNSDIFG